jgi:hypothetical protein
LKLLAKLPLLSELGLTKAISWWHPVLIHAEPSQTPANGSRKFFLEGGIINYIVKKHFPENVYNMSQHGKGMWLPPSYACSVK